ncbi:MAG TPA: MlaD family protein [Solirubrobacterales bacterium]|nr:MlaD family protein [Solirubrobacterales bacterium]
MSRLPERDIRAITAGGRFRLRPSNAMIAVIFIIVFTLGPYLAFTGHVPFTSYGYELHATFTNSANIAVKSPVRIAGVEVGEVISSSREGDDTNLTFSVESAGRPIHADAYAEIRPRIFLEGNFFVELDPGSPSAPELGSGGTIPVSRTSTAVQLDEVLTALQSPVRADLSHLLESYGEALTHKPTAAENATQLPEVRGKNGAEGLNGAFRYGGPAGRSTAQVSNAFLGTQEGDLSRLIAGAGRTFGAFASREGDLQGLIDNFDVFTGALAAQSTNLSATIHLLGPTLHTAHASLVSLDRALPPLRSYAIELTPAVAQLPGLIAASKPWLKQTRPLLSAKEGGGTARLLRELTPGYAGAAQAGKEIALPQLNQLSLCTTNVLVPTGNQTIEDRFSTGGPNYREFFYALSNFAGSTQNFDGNGPYLRVQGGGGSQLLRQSNPNGRLPTEKEDFGNAAEVPLGDQPQLGGKPPKKPSVSCDKNPVPDVNGPLGQVGPSSLQAASP